MHHSELFRIFAANFYIVEGKTWKNKRKFAVRW